MLGERVVGWQRWGGASERLLGRTLGSDSGVPTLGPVPSLTHCTDLRQKLLREGAHALCLAALWADTDLRTASRSSRSGPAGPRAKVGLLGGRFKGPWDEPGSGPPPERPARRAARVRTPRGRCQFSAGRRHEEARWERPTARAPEWQTWDLPLGLPHAGPAVVHSSPAPQGGGKQGSTAMLGSEDPREDVRDMRPSLPRSRTSVSAGANVDKVPGLLLQGETQRKE